MRIALVIDSITQGGAERQALYTARRLARRGCDVELVHYYPLSSAGYDPSLAGGAKLTWLPKERRPLRFLLRLRAHLARRRFQVVHSFMGSPSLYGGLAAWLARVPVIVGSYRGGRYEEPELIRLAHRLLDRVQAAWVVNSEVIVEELVAKVHVDRQRCRVVPNAIDSEAFRSRLGPDEARAKLGLPAGCETVAIVAVLRPEKKHALFLEAAALVARARPAAHFLIVGEGRERAAIEAGVARLGLGGRVHMLGMRRDVADVLAATDVSVLTSAYEGLSNAVMESLVASVPVVSTDYPGVEELVRDGREGHVVPQGDARALADRISRLLANPQHRERMGRSGRERIETRYGLDAMVSRLLGLYQGLLEESVGARRRAA